MKENAKGFQPTRWTLVLQARDESQTEARAALSELCRIYWPPIYRFARSSGVSADAAEDVVQDFFVHLLTKDLFGRADRARGRLRSFLLKSFTHFLHNQWRTDSAAKRGGGKPVFSIDATGFTEIAANDRPDDSPEAAYDREWALLIIKQATGNLRQSYAARGREAVFGQLSSVLAGQKPDYPALEAELSMKESSLRVEVKRLRERFKKQLHKIVADTVESPADVDDEIRYLFAVLAR